VLVGCSVEEDAGTLVKAVQEKTLKANGSVSELPHLRVQNSEDRFLGELRQRSQQWLIDS